MHARNTDVPDRFWELVAPLLPEPKRSRRGGRPRTPNRVVLAGILYKLRTGCQWKAIPVDFGSGSTCHRRFGEWARRGIFNQMYRRLLRHYDDQVGIDWMWTALDGVIVKAPKGGITQAEILPIGPRVAPNAISSRTRKGSHSASCSAGPMCPTCGWH